MNNKKRPYTHSRMLVFIFLSMITLVYGGDSFLENVTFFNWMAFFSFLMLVVLIFLRLFINTNKAIIMTLLLWLFLFIAGKIEDWYRSYIPIVGYSSQSPYEYGEYKEDAQIQCLIDVNITNLFYGYDFFHNFIITTDTNIQLVSYDSIYEEYPNMRDVVFECQDKLKKLSTYKIAYINDKVFLFNNNKTISTYSYFWDRQRKGDLFTKIEDKIETYLDRNSEYYNLNKQLIYGKQSKLFTGNYDCNSTGYAGIIMDKKEKSFYLCKEQKRYQMTHLKYTPKIATYIPDSDTVLIAYEEKKGLYILRNKYTKIYNHIQDSVTALLEALNQPKWNKPDLSKIDLDQNKLKKIIDIFTPYEKNQHHSVYYSVINYDGHQSTVKANIDDKDTVLFNLKLEKGNWNIKEIE